MSVRENSASHESAAHAVALRLLRDPSRYLGSASAPQLGRISESDNPYSRTARIEFNYPEGPRGFYVKLPVIDRHNRDVVHERLEREYHIMRQLHDWLEPFPDLFVVRPAAYFADIPALVTEEARGNTLQQLISSGTRKIGSARTVRQLQSHCALAGRWLAKFQEFTFRGHRRFLPEDTIEYCSLRIDRLLSREAPVIDSRFPAEFEAFVRTLAAEVPEAQNPVAGRHNDFAPHNMVINDSAIYVLDFTMFDYAERFYDAAAFWNRLETTKCDPTHSSTALSLLQESFLDGYGEPSILENPGFTIARSKLQIMQILATVPVGDPSPYRAWCNRRIRRKALSWLETVIDQVNVGEEAR